LLVIFFLTIYNFLEIRAPGFLGGPRPLGPPLGAAPGQGHIYARTNGTFALGPLVRGAHRLRSYN